MIGLWRATFTLDESANLPSHQQTIARQDGYVHLLPLLKRQIKVILCWQEPPTSLTTSMCIWGGDYQFWRSLNTQMQLQKTLGGMQTVMLRFASLKIIVHKNCFLINNIMSCGCLPHRSSYIISFSIPTHIHTHLLHHVVVDELVDFHFPYKVVISNLQFASLEIHSNISFAISLVIKHIVAPKTIHCNL